MRDTVLIDDSFIRKYYHVSLVFFVFSLLEGISYSLARITALNFVYLLFEVIWFLFSVLLLLYIVVHHYPKALISLPLLFLCYFAISLVYTVEYGQQLVGLDRELFIRNNAIIVFAYAALGFCLYFVIWRRYFRKYL